LLDQVIKLPETSGISLYRLSDSMRRFAFSSPTSSMSLSSDGLPSHASKIFMTMSLTPGLTSRSPFSMIPLLPLNMSSGLYTTPMCRTPTCNRDSRPYKRASGSDPELGVRMKASWTKRYAMLKIGEQQLGKVLRAPRLTGCRGSHPWRHCPAPLDECARFGWARSSPIWSRQ
jgi:hypothetical protein